MKNEKIYKVTTEGDVEGRTIRTIGYATGNVADIRVYYEDEKYYTLSVEELVVTNITPELANRKSDLLKRKLELEAELSEINKMLK